MKLILKHFNAVISSEKGFKWHFDANLGIAVHPNAVWELDLIKEFIRDNYLSGEQLNSTFYKNFQKVVDSNRLELYIDQILHYISTYGTGFTGEIYIPSQELNIPNDVKVRVINAYSVKELTNKILNVFASGVALDAETINDYITILTKELNYTFDGSEEIRNKEAAILLADKCGIYPRNPVEFLRYIIYKTTDTSLLIKNGFLIRMIKESDYDPTSAFKKFGLKKLAQVFNRFKPLFLAYKPRANSVINKISKLSKKHHRPMKQAGVNLVTQRLVDAKELKGATNYALFRAASAIKLRLAKPDNLIYFIRNGETALDENPSYNVNDNTLYTNIITIQSILAERLKERFEGKTVLLDSFVNYALPSSQKNFIDGVPIGTSITLEHLLVGIYWENEWGVRDYDLSSISVDGKLGWNASYNNSDKVVYSGDVTNAPNGASEFFSYNGISTNYLINNNIYAGTKASPFKLIIANDNGKLNKNYVVNPKNVIFESKVIADNRQSSIGVVHPDYDKNGEKMSTYILMNKPTVGGSISYSHKSYSIRSAFIERWKHTYRIKEFFDYLLSVCDLKIINDENDISENDEVLDLRIDTLESDTLINLFS